MTDIADLKRGLADRYRIERELGAGGMATVYLAHDRKHDRPVALKVLRPELAAGLGVERFDREIRISAQLQHPHVLTLIDSGRVGDLFYYVMPFVEGESLRARLERGGALPVDEAVRYLRDVVDALAAAHARGIVHRDIKPDNVLVSGRHALVTDFGVAKALSEAQATTQLTTAGMSLGTPAYMAPEQAAGDPDVDHRADLYAVGVLAYEMLTGQPPFGGQTARSIMAAHLTEQPEPVARRRTGLPEPLAAAVMRCLAKVPEDRWQQADDLLRELEALATPGSGIAAVAASARSPRVAALAAAAVILVGALAVWGLRAARQATAFRWAREEAVPRLQRLIEADSAFAAWALWRELERRAPGDPALADLRSAAVYQTAITSNPPGAQVSIRDFGTDDAPWIPLGVTPLDSLLVPRGYLRVRIEKEGFAPFDGASVHWRFADVYALDSAGATPPGMVRVAGGETELQLPGLDHLPAVGLGDFWIDRYEVTNREFKAFVDSGGYARPEWWEEPFDLAGRRLSFAEAMARFVDGTGRPGPATWEAGSYPSGRDDYPVTGVSWYEAAAYARFAGKQIPTIYHWARAAETWASAWIVPRSNLNGDGVAPVGRFRGLGPYATFDMAGNAREWCANALGTERYILGGGWNDPPYGFNDGFSRPPFDRSATNGIRLARYAAGEDLTAARSAVTRLVRDFRRERPVSDEVFRVYRRLYDYDRTPLNAVVEEVDSSAADWVRERIAFDAAYGERMFGYLFTPKHGRPPYQTIVYYPGSNAIFARSSQFLRPSPASDFIVKSGRALFHPIYKSTYERGDSLRSDYANESAFYKEHVIAWVKDFRRSVDYLATRADIDTTAFGYYGVSWGGYLGGLIPALEPRLKAVALYVAGLENQRGQPEVEPINYLPRITVPVLMLNGQYDHYFPVETQQRPMFELLGTPPAHKKWVVAPGGHFVPRARLIAETLDWLDRYLGPVR